ncbi:MAG: hypothetical protein HZB87_11260, partial [Desulfatitalea sp.]|nr:hypothetical protein [Desulfatitalea sp.]
MAKKGHIWKALQWAILAAMLVGLPLTGLLLAGRDVRAYLEFPPLTLYLRHAPFSWGVFLLCMALDLLL